MGYDLLASSRVLMKMNQLRRFINNLTVQLIEFAITHWTWVETDWLLLK